MRERGHDVHPVTLTGLGDRAHLGTPETDLELHVRDVVATIEAEALSDVVLVAHSYGAAPSAASPSRPSGACR